MRSGASCRDDLVRRFTHRIGSLHAIRLPDGRSSTPSRGDPRRADRRRVHGGARRYLERFAREMPVDILAHPTLAAVPLRRIAARGALDRGTRRARRSTLLLGAASPSRSRIATGRTNASFRRARSIAASASRSAPTATRASRWPTSRSRWPWRGRSACPTTDSTIRPPRFAHRILRRAHPRREQFAYRAVIRYHARYVLPSPLRQSTRRRRSPSRRAASLTSAREVMDHKAATSILATPSYCPGSSTRTAISSSPRCAAFSRTSTSAAGFFVSRAASAPCSRREMLLDSARYGLDGGTAQPASRPTPTPATPGVALRRDARVRRARHHVSGGLRPDPAQCRSSLAELREKIDRLRPSQTHARPHRRLAARAIHRVRRAVLARRRSRARRITCRWRFTSPRVELEQDLVVRGAGPFADGLRRRGIAVAPRASLPIALLQFTRRPGCSAAPHSLRPHR